MTTKAETILALYAKGTMSVKEIAEKVGTSPEYVRVVARQRNGSGLSDIDRRYRTSSLGKATMAKFNESRAAARRAYYKTLYDLVPPKTRVRVFADAYRAARLSGLTVSEAQRAGTAAVKRVAASKMSSREAARRAYAAAIEVAA